MRLNNNRLAAVEILLPDRRGGLMTDNDQLFKLSYKELAIEVTRRCNMQCSHCMRGHAENHTISKEVVDRLLDEVSVVGRLLLTGGEPFLEVSMLLIITVRHSAKSICDRLYQSLSETILII